VGERPAGKIKGAKGQEQRRAWTVVRASLVFDLVFFGYFGVCAYVANNLSQPDILPNHEDAGSLGIPYEEVVFPSRGDSLRLSGWLFPREGSPAGIVLVHGKPGHRANPEIGLLPLAKDLHDLGYNVLTFDLRGWGQSQKSRFSLGQNETRDVLGAVDYLKGRAIERVGVIGFSMGGAAAILAAAQDREIRALVEDSGYENAREIVDLKLPRLSHLPEVFTPGVVLMTKILFGIDLNSVKPIREVGKIKPRRVYFIHGEVDTTIPVEHARRLFQSAANPADDLWIVPGGRHVKSYLTHREEYLERVGKFFGRELK
jgi:fermentation-respiration switch protein FrsA (DUF1100 family)